jgi:ribose transport system permease protein
MTMTARPDIDHTTAQPAVVSAAGPRRQPVARFAVLGLIGALVLLFSALRPDTFATTDNLSTILLENAVLTMLALAVMVPLIANDFDLSVASVLGLASMLAAGLPGRQGFSVAMTIGAVLLLGVAVGLLHAALIVGLGLPSFVVTLGTNSVLGGLIILYSDGAVIYEAIPDAITTLGTAKLLGVGLPIIFMAVLAAILWFVLEQRPAGRLLYAVGASEPAARLAGVRTGRARTVALVSASVIAAFAGLMLTARVGSASPTSYTAFFLPAFAAAFLSLAAFRLGHYNPLGVVAAVYLLAVGVTGLALLGVPSWVEPVFNGAALLIAIALSRLTSGSMRRVTAL